MSAKGHLVKEQPERQEETRRGGDDPGPRGGKDELSCSMKRQGK